MEKKSNSNLHKAKQVKNDEFYTQRGDIQNELKHYKEHFRDKVVFCNCDDPEWSEFWIYFKDNFKHLGLKKLISTHYEKDSTSYMLEKLTNEEEIKTDLKGNGDFRSDECINLLKEADIVVTNPPFSLFREFVAKLNEYDKKFLIIGSKNAITYKETFKLIKNDVIWLGITSPKTFLQPDGKFKKFGNIGWFTNLVHKKRNLDIDTYKSYYENKEDYPKYDLYDAINVSKVSEIPDDYEKEMGVPITFLDKYNPNQFEIMSSNDIRRDKSTPFKEHGLIKDKDGTINGKACYVRIVIKKR